MYPFEHGDCIIGVGEQRPTDTLYRCEDSWARLSDSLGPSYFVCSISGGGGCIITSVYDSNLTNHRSDFSPDPGY